MDGKIQDTFGLINYIFACVCTVDFDLKQQEKTLPNKGLGSVRFSYVFDFFNKSLMLTKAAFI